MTLGCVSPLAGVWVWDRVHTHPHCSSWNPAHASGFNSARPPPSSASKRPVSATFSLMTGLCLSASCSCEEPGDLRALFRQARWLSAFYRTICLQNCALPSCGFCVKIFLIPWPGKPSALPNAWSPAPGCSSYVVMCVGSQDLSGHWHVLTSIGEQCAGVLCL